MLISDGDGEGDSYQCVNVLIFITQYYLSSDRNADSHILTIYSSSNTLIVDLSVVNLGPIDEDTTYSPLPQLTYLEVGSEQGSTGCVSRLTVNGRLQNMFNVTNSVKSPEQCSQPW